MNKNRPNTWIEWLLILFFVDVGTISALILKSAEIVLKYKVFKGYKILRYLHVERLNLYMEKDISNLQNIIFNKNKLFNMLINEFGVLSNNTLEKYLKRYLDSGQIARVGRNAYCIKNNLKDYEFTYSDISINIAKILTNNFDNLDFRIFELYQLNPFLNHQIAHNAIFVFIEKELTMTAFELLRKEYLGKILINPTIKDFFNYRQENIIIIRNLLTESPKSKELFWHTNLEKMLVDIVADKLLKAMFSESEYPNIFITTFETYVIDESQMFRYARRRKAENKIKGIINEETDIKLHVK